MVLECECGYVAKGDDEQRLVDSARSHAWLAHGVELPSELILELASNKDRRGEA